MYDIVLCKILLERLCEEFGNILLADGSLNRKKLSQIAFNDKSTLDRLNNLTHPAIMEELFLRASGHKLCFCEVFRRLQRFLYYFASYQLLPACTSTVSGTLSFTAFSIAFFRISAAFSDVQRGKAVYEFQRRVRKGARLCHYSDGQKACNSRNQFL